MRSIAATLTLLLSAAVAAGCGDESKVASMMIEVPTEMAPCQPATPVEAPVDQFRCALISVCERSRGEGSATCKSVPATTGNRYDEAGEAPLGDSVLVAITPNGDYSFQINLDEGEIPDPPFDQRFLEITTVLYGPDGVPRYRGIRTGLKISEFFSSSIRTRVYPFARTACAGPDAGGRRLRERAFHAATRLPNGDVLIYGGVRGGAAVVFESDGIGSDPQPAVEIYRIQEDRVEEVEGTFSRVLFGSVLLTEEADANEYRIYVSGGFDSIGNLLRYDVNQNMNFHGTPLLVGEGAEAQPDVTLVYDRTANSIRVEVEGAETFGGVVSDDSSAMDFLPVVGGVTSASTDRAWVFTRDNRWISRGGGGEVAPGMGMRSVGNADRFGHSVTLLPSGQTFVWGGNMAIVSPDLPLEPPRDILLNTAGQIFRRVDGTVRDASSATSGAPPPSAFHTATSLGGSDVMLIGGLLTSCINDRVMGCGSNGITTTPVDEPVVRVTVTPDGITDVFYYTEQPFENSIFHVATPLDDDSLLMTGGSSCTTTAGSCDLLKSLTDTDRIFAVSRDLGAINEPDDDLPDALLQGRFGHQVTRLDVCPPEATDCSDPRFLVTGGFMRISSGMTNTIQTTRVAEVILKQRTGARGPLVFDEDCILARPDGGMDGGMDAAVPTDTSVPDAPADSMMDGG